MHHDFLSAGAHLIFLAPVPQTAWARHCWQSQQSYARCEPNSVTHNMLYNKNNAPFAEKQDGPKATQINTLSRYMSTVGFYYDSSVNQYKF